MMHSVIDHRGGYGLQITREVRGIIMICMLISACTSQAPGTRPAGTELVYADTSAVWFEDSHVAGEPTSHGRWLILADWRPRSVIELETGREASLEEVAPGHGLERLLGVRDAGGGRTAFYGVRGSQSGWFVQAPDTVMYTGLPRAAAPAWSADGTRLAYFVADGDTLYLAGEHSTLRLKVGRPAGPPVWAPDGGSVYVMVRANDGAGSLLRVRWDDHLVEVLRNGLYISDVTTRFAVSLDGQRLFLALAGPVAPAAEARHSPTPQRYLDIYAFDPVSKTLDPVVQTPHADFAPVTAGKWLYWTRNAYADAVVIVPATGGEPRILVTDAILPSWSPDGKRVAFTYGNFGGVDGAISKDAAVIDLDEEGHPSGEALPIVTGFHEDFTPTWSPDGSWIAYHSHRSSRPVMYYAGAGTTDDIYLRRPEAPMSEEIRLTDFGWEVGPADWSPDGRRVAFASWERGSLPGIAKPWIATINPADGRLIELERLGLPDGVENATMPVWSPDGREIALDVRRGGARHELWVVRPDGSGSERLVEFRSETYGGVHWTPDGRFLVYAALADRRMQLFRVRRTGGEPEQLTRDAANVLHPRVSPDGRWIAASRLVRVKEVWRLELR